MRATDAYQPVWAAWLAVGRGNLTSRARTCYFFKVSDDERVDIALYVDDGYVLG